MNPATIVCWKETRSHNIFINKTTSIYKGCADKKQRYCGIHKQIKHSTKLLSEAKYLESKPKGENAILLNEQFQQFNKERIQDNKEWLFWNERLYLHHMASFPVALPEFNSVVS